MMGRRSTCVQMRSMCVQMRERVGVIGGMVMAAVWLPTSSMACTRLCRLLSAGLAYGDGAAQRLAYGDRAA
eukprot:126986-Chlamydomonas_euryale.AAC.5